MPAEKQSLRRELKNLAVNQCRVNHSRCRDEEMKNHNLPRVGEQGIQNHDETRSRDDHLVEDR